MNEKVETEAEKFLEERGVPLELMNCMAFDLFNVERSDPEDYVRRLTIRDDFIARFGFAVLTSEAVDFISSYPPLLEVGAGSGYWAYELRKAGIDVIATDPGTGKYNHRTDYVGGMTNWPAPWMDIERIDGVTAVTTYPNRNLLIVWPDYDNPWAAETLGAFTGQKVLYVGEGEGGCTGDGDFHALLEERFESEEAFKIPQFTGIHDRLEVWARK